MYYANEFIYYYLMAGKKHYQNYTGINLYKSQQEALDNAEGEWLTISGDSDILIKIQQRKLYIWNDNEEQESSTEK